jgi:hypothetical protein
MGSACDPWQPRKGRRMAWCPFVDGNMGTMGCSALFCPGFPPLESPRATVDPGASVRSSCVPAESVLVNTSSGSPFAMANEMLSLSGILNETRQYNSMFQLTQITVPRTLNMQYAYSPTQNNGKITSQTGSGLKTRYTPALHQRSGRKQKRWTE